MMGESLMDENGVPRPESELSGLDSVLSYYEAEFVRNLLRDSESDISFEDLKILDQSGSDFLSIGPDRTLAFIGRDETASNAGIFGFTVCPSDPVPFVGTVEEALGLLKPTEVLDSSGVQRQGEWFFVPVEDSPDSQVFKGGVGSRPYLESPLQNHVPRDYAFGASVQEIMERIGQRISDLLERVNRFQKLIEALSGMHQWHWLNSYIGRSGEVTLQELYQEVFGGVYVRGTVRHRRKDHGMLSLGEQWHRAYTHGFDVQSAGPDKIFD